MIQPIGIRYNVSLISFKNGKEISEIWFRAKQLNTPFLLPKQEEVKAELRKILSQTAK
uniref:hypothetical protein n=1 Tax=Ornithobacterium rhinotracheale TaxID=28251 RepID=UPI0039A72ED9